MFSINKNSYLQCGSGSVNPRIINRCVDFARAVPLVPDAFDFEPPFFRLTSHQPDIPVDRVDVTRRPLAFGALALPKLRRELHHKDHLVVLQALTSLGDLLHDPERAYEALKLRIPDRLADLLLDALAPVREKTVLVLAILAELEEGRSAIVKNSEILENLGFCLGDQQPSVRLKTAACFEMLARSWMTADVLVEWGLIPTLLEAISHGDFEETVELHLDTLKSLMYGCGKCVALKHDAFKVFKRLLDDDDRSEIVRKALDCLMLLTSTKKGKKLALDQHLLKTLNKFLHYADTQTCTSAVSVVMFSTIKIQAKNAVVEIGNLVHRLIQLATNPLNPTLQMYCLQALTNICEHSEVRKQAQGKYFEKLKGLQVAGENVQHKKILLRTIGWRPQLDCK